MGGHPCIGFCCNVAPPGELLVGYLMANVLRELAYPFMHRRWSANDCACAIAGLKGIIAIQIEISCHVTGIMRIRTVKTRCFFFAKSVYLISRIF